MKTYNQFINEGIRDKMIPKSEEYVRKSLEGLNDFEKMNKAIEHDLVWLAKEVIDNGFDLNGNAGGGNKYGHRFLERSITSGSVGMTKFLIEKGFDIDEYFLNSLEEVIKDNHLEMAKFLIDKGAVIDSEYDEGELIGSAISNGNVEMLKLILDNDKNTELYVDKKWFIKMLNQNYIKEDMLKLMIDRIPMVKKISTEILKDYKKTIELLNKCL